MPRGAPLLALLALCAAASPAQAVVAASPVFGALLDKAAALEPWLVATRRALHQSPELFWQESNTSAYIRRTLDELGIPYK